MTEALKIPDETLKQQFASSDPKSSAWVAANAGSGKTHVLTQRVIRLLLDGNAPDRILCLTFTKAAAANMKSRVFETLAQWTMMPDDALEIAITSLSGELPSRQQRNRARSLFAAALDAPGGLKIQTIHSFCETLLRQFPLEANVPSQFTTIQEAGQAELLERAKSEVLSGERSNPEHIEHYLTLARDVSGDAIERALAMILAMRSEFHDWIGLGMHNAMRPLYDLTGVAESDTRESLLSRGLLKLLPHHPTLKSLRDLAVQSDKAADQSLAERLSGYLDGTSDPDRFSCLQEAVLTAKMEPRKERGLVTKFVKDQMPDAVNVLHHLADQVLQIREMLTAQHQLQLSHHLFCLADAVLERYEALKRRHGVIDYDDQIHKSANLLTRSEIRDWIRFRLDRGIDHLLVDEAQDTSPKQWEIINAVTEDFYAGDSVARQERTVFVVGDEKQSIYSFQGADPQEFARQEQLLETAVSTSGKIYHRGKMHLSFRSTPDILKAVDRVFESESNRRGLTQTGEQPIHDAIRGQDPGEVQLWPMLSPITTETEEDWTAPIDRVSTHDPAVRLARKICDAIKSWVGQPLPGSNRPVSYGDILILVRKRDRFITALTRVMKDEGIAVAGADKIVLTEHIAIEDLLAVARFVQLTSDDLNLACVLKSPLFNASEDQLFELAHGRQGTLWAALVAARDDPTHPCHAFASKAVAKLEQIRDRVRVHGVFEFFTWLLGPHGARKAFLARLGAEAEDILDAFLEEALNFDRDGGKGLEGFITSLIRSRPEIKREVDLDRDEVRILTAHAAKGLEARVVFVVDPGSKAWNPIHRPVILRAAGSYLWVPNKAFETSVSTPLIQSLRSAAEEEYRRLLYVAMTRAADRLVVCGYHGAKAPDEKTWHAMVEEALSPDAEPLFDEQGCPDGLVWRTERQPGGNGDAQTPVERSPDETRSPSPEIPSWALAPAKPEWSLPAPLSPAGAFALIDNDPDIPIKPNPEGLSGFMLERGVAIHKLLELLPDVKDTRRCELAAAYLARVGSQWERRDREAVWRDVQTVLDHPEFAHLFSLPSQSEVSVTGELSTRNGKRMIYGQIDRLVVTGDQVTVIDYKSGTPPISPEETPQAYTAQLALYREMLVQIYPERNIRCALLWTRVPTLQHIPDPWLDEAIVKIREI